jgi:hypothetical protein
MLYAMKDYESVGVTYPVTVRSYINALCKKIGLNFKNKNDEFANYNREIQNELYIDADGNNLGFTYRDVLDELAQVTASMICINEKTDELEIRYPVETNDSIDEEFLKDTNVEFKEKYGKINSVVLSRSAESDNIYLRDEDSVRQDGLCEIKIVDNQIMNFNDRSDYLPDILEKLDGTEYYIIDVNSTGIMWYELGDVYNMEVEDKTYKCLMLNDEVNINQGIEELIYTDMPEESETDYTKADKTDRKINQTNLIVDKQNQQIQGVVAQIGDRSQKQTTITQDLNSITQQIQDIEDITDEVNGLTQIKLDNCVEGSLLEFHIYGNNSVFTYTYPSNSLYPLDTLYPRGDSRIVVTNEEGTNTIYELGVMDVLRQNGDVRDEYILQKGNAKVIRRINQDGTIKIQETTENLGQMSIALSEGTNIIKIQNYSANMKAKFAIRNDYTEVFATKVEMSSNIRQTAEEINLEVSKKVDENKIISKINQSAEEVSIEAGKISLSGKTLNLADNMAIVSKNFNVDKNGNMTCSNAKITDGTIKIYGGNYSSPKFQIYNDNHNWTRITPNALWIRKNNDDFTMITLQVRDDDGPSLYLGQRANSTVLHQFYMECADYRNTSVEEIKENIEKYNKNALDIIKGIDIYSYDYKGNKCKKKKIGLVIGDNYKYSKEITDDEEKSVNLYSFISVCCKAIQEQQEEIEELQNKIKELEDKNG